MLEDIKRNNLLIAGLTHDEPRNPVSSSRPLDKMMNFYRNRVSLRSFLNSVNHKLLGTNVKIRVSALTSNEKNSMSLRAIALRQLAVLAETPIST
jgi:hypothetical protein